MKRSWRQWLLPGVDEPIHRDWLIWISLLIMCAWLGVQVAATGWEVIFGLPVGFLLPVWVLAALRNLVRGYRDPRTPPPAR